MPFLQTSDLLIAYEQAGNGDRLLVLVHGNWASKRWWQPMLHHLPPAYRAVAPDLRGCGATVGLNHGYTIAEHANDLLSFLDKLGIKRATLVGHSLGGAIVTQLALAAPQRVQALVLVGPAPADGMQLDAQVYHQFPVLKHNRWLLAHVLGQLMPGVRPTPFRDALINDAMTARLAAVTGNARALEHWNVAAHLPRMKVPTLIVRGDEDRLISRAHAQRWRSLVPGSRLETIPRCGHSPNVERPDLFAQIVFSFLEEQHRSRNDQVHASRS